MQKKSTLTKRSALPDTGVRLYTRVRLYMDCTSDGVDGCRWLAAKRRPGANTIQDIPPFDISCYGPSFVDFVPAVPSTTSPSRLHRSDSLPSKDCRVRSRDDGLLGGESEARFRGNSALRRTHTKVRRRGTGGEEARERRHNKIKGGRQASLFGPCTYKRLQRGRTPLSSGGQTPVNLVFTRVLGIWNSAKRTSSKDGYSSAEGSCACCWGNSRQYR